LSPREVPRNKFAERDTAVEILAIYTAEKIRRGAPDSEMRILISERRSMYLGDEETIQKILTVYAEEVRSLMAPGAENFFGQS